MRIVNRIGFFGTSSDNAWRFEIPSPENEKQDKSRVRSDGLLKYYAENIFPHEAGHHAFEASVGSRRLTASQGQYSTQFPDWIDEAVAIWMETAKMRGDRMKKVQGKSPSLERIARIENPYSGPVSEPERDLNITSRTVLPPCPKCTFLPESVRTKYQIVDTGTDQFGKMKTVNWLSETDPHKDQSFEGREFYAVAYSLLRFIRSRGGTAAVRELIARYEMDPRPRVTVFSGLPGLPASVAAFEKAWHAFLAKPPKEIDR